MTKETLSNVEPNYVFLGTLDDKVAEYPFAVGPSHLVSKEKVIIANALLSPPIVIEEGHLLASSDVMASRETDSVLLAFLRTGLLKIMSRQGNLPAYYETRRRNAHAVPPPGARTQKLIESIQLVCENCGAFLPYPPSSIDRFTFDRFNKLLRSASLQALASQFSITGFNAFEDSFCDTYAHGNRGGQWTSRSAWEQSAKTVFAERPAIIRVLMSVANRERHILRAAGLARALGKDTIVETGFDVGDATFTKRNTPMMDEIGLRTLARRSFFEQISLDDVTRAYPILFEALSDPTSKLAQKKAIWLKSSMHPGADGDANDYSLATREYREEIANYLVSVGQRPRDTSSNVNLETLSNAAFGMLVPASFNLLLNESSSNMSRRQMLSALLASGAGMGFYQLRSWGNAGDRPARSRLITARSPDKSSMDESALTQVFQDNFHERLVVSHEKASALMPL